MWLDWFNKIEGKNKFYRAATNDERIEQILDGQQDIFMKIKEIQKMQIR